MMFDMRNIFGSYSEYEFEIPKSARKCDILVEEIVGNLRQDTRTKLLREASRTIQKPSCFDKAVDNSVLLVESLCRREDNVQYVWDVFDCHGVRVEEVECKESFGSSGVKHKDRYSLVVYDKFAYIQLVCKAKRVRYDNSWFSEGEIITIFLTDKSKSIVTIQPKTKQTYVPLRPKQQMQLIVEEDEVEWKGESIKYCCKKKIGKFLWSHFFECIEEVRDTNYVFTQKNDVISVPDTDFYTDRFANIINPVDTCVIYAHNIGGFLIRNSPGIVIKIAYGCPIGLVYSSSGLEANGLSWSKIRLRITQPQRYFVLARTNNEWMIKT